MHIAEKRPWVAKDRRRCCFGLLLIAVFGTLAAGGVKVEFVSQWGGGANDLILDGSIIYTSIGARLAVIDVSDPTNPTAISTSLVLPSAIYGLAKDGDRLYVAATAAGLCIVDVSDPATPQVLGSVLTPDDAVGVAVRGDYAYVADVSYGLQVIDVSDPAAPQVVAGTGRENWGYDVAVIDHYAYFSNSLFGIRVFDVADPSNPIKVTDLKIAAGSTSVVQVNETTAYATGSQGLKVLDISDPANPAVVSGASTTSSQHSAIRGDVAAVAGGWDGLWLLNVSDPRRPRHFGHYLDNFDTPGFGFALAMAGTIVYLADWNGGLKCIDVADPEKPKIVGVYDAGASPYLRNVAYADGIGILGTIFLGVRLIDLTSPTTPRGVGQYDPGKLLLYHGIAAESDRAYLPHSDGLDIVDISDPTQPERAAFMPSSTSITDVSIDGGLAFATESDVGIKIIERETNSVVGEFTEGQWAEAKGVRMYCRVADGTAIVDIADPSSPQQLGVIPIGGTCAVALQHAYVAEYPDLLRIFDLEDVANPRQVGTYGDDVRLMRVQGRYAFVCLGGGSLFAGGRALGVLNLSQPAEPHYVGALSQPIEVFDLTIEDSYLFVASMDGGLFVLRSTIPADLNCDGFIDFADIDPFVELLTAPDDYAAHYPLCNPANGDIDEDGDATFADIDGFVACLIEGGCP